MVREGDPLGTDAKFHLVEAGTVHCLKSYEVRHRAHRLHCRPHRRCKSC